MSLNALGFVCDNNLDATILSIDGTHGKNGYLRVGYDPCDQDGKPFCQENENTDPHIYADIPNDLLVDEVEELINYKDKFFFKLRVEMAIDLPRNLNNNAFVTYQFKFKKGRIYKTEEVKCDNSKNVWNYSRLHTIEKITPAILQEFKEGSISFQIYAYPPNYVK